MAPDINTLPTSSRPPPSSQPTSTTTSTIASRRTSQMMAPPPVPISSTHVLRSPVIGSNDYTGVPLRHPRPLTAAELYLECEKEQEAVVNRLTRELSALRAQTASVVSNASHSSTSTSASLLPIDVSDSYSSQQMNGATHPTPSRRHRSSSSVSTRSNTTPATTASASGSTVTNTSTHVQPTSTVSIPALGVSQASADRAAAAARATIGSISRQPSVGASGRSTPARQSLDLARHGQTPASLFSLPHRPLVSRDPSSQSTAAQPGTPLPHPLSSPHSPLQTIHHYNETAAYRSEMEIVKAENESLRQRVRALERALRTRRRDSSQSDISRILPQTATEVPRSSRESFDIARPAIASPGVGVAAWAAGSGGVGGVAGPRERSESQSTTASSRPGILVDDEVRFGESAGGVGRGL